MPRKRNATPSYQKHSSARARAAWTDHLGYRREKMLPGLNGSPESKAAYARVILELAASPASATARKDINVAEMLLAFSEHAENYYLTPEGKPGREVRDLNDAHKAVWRVYGDTPAREFGPLALKAVREQMVRDGLSRKVINARVNKIKRAWKWATSEEMIPPSAYEALRTVSGLRKGKTAAIEHPLVKPVDWKHVKATLPYLSAQVRAMVLLLWHTGARPS